MIKQGKAAAGAARSAFSQGRKMGGNFAGIGAIGRKSVSTMDAKVLARSGKMRSAAVAAGALGMAGMGKRRGSGTGRRTPGRPTGMYGY
jgi:hypothetical protein